jgi:hypothetical protein
METTEGQVVNGNANTELAHGGIGAAAVGGGATALSSAFGVNEVIAIAGVIATFLALAVGMYYHRKQFALAQEALALTIRFREREIELMQVAATSAQNAAEAAEEAVEESTS